MSDSKDKLIEALRHAVEAKDGLIEALNAAVDAYKGLAEARKALVERLRAEVAALESQREPGYIRRREDCHNCAPCPCAETD
jgi:uncharacterized protein (DUF488 family)